MTYLDVGQSISLTCMNVFNRLSTLKLIDALEFIGE